MLLLALSDAHIPDRATDLPVKFKKLLSVPDKISQVALLGNSTKSYDFLKFVNQISNNITIVRGEFDNGHLPSTKKDKASDNSRPMEEIPMNSIIRQGALKIGCCSGYTVVPKNDPLSLLALARQLDVDILLWGGTHNVEAYTLEGKFFVNPGSCTGAFNTDWPIVFDVEDSDEAVTSEVDKPTKENQSEDDDAKGGSTGKEQPGSYTPKEGTAEERENENESNVKPENQFKEDEVDMSDSDINGSNSPSFCLLDIQGNTCTLYIYLYVNGEVKVDKVVYEKE
ncbi:ADE_G0023160.mRNA.1.CDS.1 [Saccharomyces cerevisiae]|nr:ADE_G0023160.mRNA.1.CDS.1 [Saccharomyces cerevisiae]CAI6700286.1 ADE_G0023160.mRNA.1.CDS.1 [Saccharomyces cerevisiae]